jgi:hypothetical protein
MLNEEFVKDLFEVCKKHRQNIQINVEGTGDVSHYEVHITGAWAIHKESDAVEVYEHKNDTLIMTIKGDK